MKTVVFSALAADPLRPSAERARPDESRPLTPLVARRRRLGNSFPRRQLSPLTCAGNDRCTASPEPPAVRAGLGRESETTRDAFHRPGPAILRPRWMVFSRTCPNALLPSGTDSRAAMKPAAVRRLEPPPHATPQVTNALRRPHHERRRYSSPTSATDLCHVHLLSIARFPVCSSYFRSPLTIQRSKPRRTPRAVSHLTTRNALRSNHRSRLRRCGGCGRP